MKVCALVVFVVLGAGLFGCKNEEPKSKKADKKEDNADEKKPAKKGGGFVGACDRREKESLCAEYAGAATKGFVKGECAEYKVPYLASPCPADGLVARCVRYKGTEQELTEVWYAPAKAETIKALCTGDGTEFSEK